MVSQDRSLVLYLISVGRYLSVNRESIELICINKRGNREKVSNK